VPSNKGTLKSPVNKQVQSSRKVPGKTNKFRATEKFRETNKFRAAEKLRETNKFRAARKAPSSKQAQGKAQDKRKITRSKQQV